MFSKTILAALALPAFVAAHGSISVPKVVFQDIYNKNAPSVLVDGPAGPYTGDLVLKDLADKHGSTCGKTDGNAPVQPIPADGIVKFDISAKHIGPCELWLDNEKVVYAQECYTKFADYKIPVDFSKCKKSKCQLRWVWLATHNSPWEIFDNCVNVGSGNGGNDAPTVAPSVAPTSAPVNRLTPAPKPSTDGPTTAPTKAPTDEPTPAPVDPDTPGTVQPYNPDGDAKYRGIDGSDALNWWCSINCSRGFCPEEKCIQA